MAVNKNGMYWNRYVIPTMGKAKAEQMYREHQRSARFTEELIKAVRKYQPRESIESIYAKNNETESSDNKGGATVRDNSQGWV